MTPQLTSYIAGTLGLAVVLVVSAFLTWLRPHVAARASRAPRFLVVAGFALSAQVLHFVEELNTRFYARFPDLLGLRPWSVRFFVFFNLVWFCIWLLAIAGVRNRIVLALLPLWFLGLASVFNGVAHPILALAVGGYFPGLFTSPLVAVGGVALILEVLRLTGREPDAA